MHAIPATPSLWFDVEDLFHYAAESTRPSGIQRMGFEVYKALRAREDAARFRFLRHDTDGCGLVPVAWAEIAALFERISGAPPVAARSPARGEKPAALGRRVLRSLRWRFHLLVRNRRRRAFAAGKLPVTRAPVQPGDALIVLGSPWFAVTYPTLAARARSELGMRFAVLVHDLGPVRHPEWFDAPLVRIFRDFYDGVLPLADQVFADSRHTAQDVEAYAVETGIRLASPVAPLPMGTGFPAAARAATGEAPRDLPPPGSYVLFVSTLEVRKNHALLVRLWRRLLAEMPAAEVPTLVFAGRVGWLVDDLMRELEKAAFLDGRIRLIRDPSDATLRRLYEGCLFTLFPSLFEGWGLPVSESLALGKPCIASNRTSLPEAGGTLARYFDPEDLDDAERVIRATLADRAGLAAWEARVRQEFRPVPWSETAAAIVARLT